MDHEKTLDNLQKFLYYDEEDDEEKAMIKEDQLLREVIPVVELIEKCWENYFDEFLVCFDNDDDNYRAIIETNFNMRKLMAILFENGGQFLKGACFKILNLIIFYRVFYIIFLTATDFKDNGGIPCIDFQEDAFTICMDMLSKAAKYLKFPMFKASPEIVKYIFILK